jgi:hypothetical protein
MPKELYLEEWLRQQFLIFNTSGSSWRTHEKFDAISARQGAKEGTSGEMPMFDKGHVEAMPSGSKGVN